MNRDKQIKSSNWLTEGYSEEELEKMKAEAIKEAEIEEMAKEFCPLFKTYGTCETCDAVLDIGDNPCVHKSIASIVIAHGYRKASEVAEEIFAEIERLLNNHHSACLPVGAIETYTYYEGGLGDAIAEFKKKYAEEVR